MSDNEYTTSLGKRVRFVPIGPRLDKLRATNPPPTVPTYTVRTATGVEEEWPLLETIPATDAEWRAAVEAQSSDEHRRAVSKFELDYDLWQRRFSRNMAKTVMMFGIETDIPEDDGWVRAQELTGTRVPSEPEARRLHYIETEVFATSADYRELFTRAFRASEVNEELVAQFEAAFQRPVERRGRTDAGRQVGVPAGKRKRR